MTQLDAALTYAARGWQVVPLHTPTTSGCTCGAACATSAGKHPRFADWPKKATADAATLKGWWRTWPAANVGIATGARSGVWVLDVDPGSCGEQTLERLVAQHGALPATLEALTGSGGRHLFWRWPAGAKIRNSQGGLGPGLDVRGDGGQVVVAPSVHLSGRRYEWQPEAAEVAEPPAWLLELVRERPAPSPAQRPPRSQPIDSARRRASAYLARIPGAVSGQGGHDRTWAAALAIVRGFRLTEGEAVELLLSEYNPKCDPPWSEKEVQHKVADASNNASVPFGYLLDAERTEHQRRPAPAAAPSTPPPSREPGCDDGDDSNQSAPLAPASPTRLGLQPVSVLLQEEILPTDWLINPWLEAGTIAALVAAPNVGKTLLAFWFATQVSAAGGRVAIIEEEGGKRGFQKRIDRAVKAIGNERCKLIDYSFKPRLNLLTPRDVRALEEELVGYRFVVIDSFARVSTGVEENDAKEMGQLVDVLDRVREATGATLLLIHHTSKARWKAGEVPALADGRGSSALQGGLDTMLALASVQDEEPGVVQFDLHVTKQRDEERVQPRRVKIAMTGPEAVVTLDNEERPRTRRAPTLAEQRVAGIVHLVLANIPLPPEAPVSREDLQDKLGRRAEDIRAAVGQLVDQGKVRELARRRLLRVPSTVADRTGERSE